MASQTAQQGLTGIRRELSDLPNEVLAIIFDKAFNLPDGYGINSPLNDVYKNRGGAQRVTLYDKTTADAVRSTCKRFSEVALKPQFKILAGHITSDRLRLLLECDIEDVHEGGLGYVVNCVYLQLSWHVSGEQSPSEQNHIVRSHRRVIEALPRFSGLTHLAIIGFSQSEIIWSKLILAIGKLGQLKALHFGSGSLLSASDTSQDDTKSFLESHSVNESKELEEWEETPVDVTSNLSIPVKTLSLDSDVFDEILSIYTFPDVQNLYLESWRKSLQDLKGALGRYNGLERLRLDSVWNEWDQFDEEETRQNFHEVLESHAESLKSLEVFGAMELQWSLRCSQLPALERIAFNADEYCFADDAEDTAGDFAGPKLNSVQITYACVWRNGVKPVVRSVDEADVDYLVKLTKALKAQGTPIVSIAIGLDHIIDVFSAQFDVMHLYDGLKGWDPARMPWDLLDEAQKEMHELGVSLHFTLPPGRRTEWKGIVRKVRAARLELETTDLELPEEGGEEVLDETAPDDR